MLASNADLSGPYNVSVTASDGVASDTEYFQFLVQSVAGTLGRGPQFYYNANVTRIGEQAILQAGDTFLSTMTMAQINDSGAGNGQRLQATGSLTLSGQTPLTTGVNMPAFAASVGVRTQYNTRLQAAEATAARYAMLRGWTATSVTTQLQLNYYVQPASANGVNRSGRCVVRWTIRFVVNGTSAGAPVSEAVSTLSGGSWFTNTSLQTMPLYVGDVSVP